MSPGTQAVSAVFLSCNVLCVCPPWDRCGNGVMCTTRCIHVMCLCACSVIHVCVYTGYVCQWEGVQMCVLCVCVCMYSVMCVG